MPVQTQVMALGARFGKRIAAAQDQNKGKEPQSFGGRLPGGIRNGVALVRLCKIEPAKNPGEFYWTGMAVVVEPKSHDGVSVEGLQTRQFVTLGDTKTSAGKEITFEMNWAEMLNHLKLLTNRETVDGITGTGEEILAKTNALMKMIEEAGIYTRFETSFGKERIDTKTKQVMPPMVFENWLGRVDYKPDSNGQATTPDNTAQAPVASTSASAPESQTFDPAADELADLAALADRPDNSPDSAAATKTMKARALAAGVAESDVDTADNWAQVAKMIKVAEAAGDQEGGPIDDGPVDDGDEAAWQASAMGKVVHYDLYSAKTKKKTKTQCEIVAVQEDKQTVHLKNLATQKVLAGKGGEPFPVKWDQIELVS